MVFIREILILCIKLYFFLSASLASRFNRLSCRSCFVSPRLRLRLRPKNQKIHKLSISQFFHLEECNKIWEKRRKKVKLDVNTCTNLKKRFEKFFKKTQK